MNRLLPTMAAAVALAVCASGCAAPSSPDSTTAPPASAVSQGDGSASSWAPIPQPTNDVDSRSDLSNEKPATWTGYEVVDQTHIRIFFTTGDPRCYGVQVATQETASTVTISLFEGLVPGASHACTAVAAFLSAVVTLNEPIGGRTVTQP